MIKGDRIFGAFMMVVALGYILNARGIQTSFMSDPVGPRLFPYLVGGVVIWKPYDELDCFVLFFFFLGGGGGGGERRE